MLYTTYKDVPLTDWRWPHFTLAELACKCASRGCRGGYWHDPIFLDALEALRALARRPLVITSWHRCTIRNVLVRGAPKSRHRKIAVDISLDCHSRHHLYRSARKCGCTGIGRGKDFIHLDRRPIPAEWTYKGADASWQI